MTSTIKYAIVHLNKTEHVYYTQKCRTYILFQKGTKQLGYTRYLAGSEFNSKLGLPQKYEPTP